MFLQVEAINRQGQSRNFICTIYSLEAAIDMLQHISTVGEQILKAEMIDNDRRTLLPPEVFEQNVFLTATRELESEWQRVLSKPIDKRSVSNQIILDFNHKRNANNELLIAQVNLAIETTERNLHLVRTTHYKEAVRLTMLDRLEKLLALYQKQLFNALNNQKRIACRLDLVK